MELQVIRKRPFFLFQRCCFHWLHFFYSSQITLFKRVQLNKNLLIKMCLNVSHALRFYLFLLVYFFRSFFLNELQKQNKKLAVRTSGPVANTGLGNIDNNNNKNINADMISSRLVNKPSIPMDEEERECLVGEDKIANKEAGCVEETQMTQSQINGKKENESDQLSEDSIEKTFELNGEKNVSSHERIADDN